ncbi:hypothetical protein Tco_0662345 [Tanacetum coccineum]
MKNHQRVVEILCADQAQNAPLLANQYVKDWLKTSRKAIEAIKDSTTVNLAKVARKKKDIYATCEAVVGDVTIRGGRAQYVSFTDLSVPRPPENWIQIPSHSLWNNIIGVWGDGVVRSINSSLGCFKQYDNPIRMLLPTRSIVVASPSSTLSDKSFLTSGDHPVGPVCGMHMMADTAAGNSKDPTELCQSVKKRITGLILSQKRPRVQKYAHSNSNITHNRVQEGTGSSSPVSSDDLGQHAPTYRTYSRLNLNLACSVKIIPQ